MSSKSGSSDDLDNWEVLSKGTNTPESDDDDSDSDSSIEVVSMDMDTDCDLEPMLSPSTPIVASNPVFILRVPSTEGTMEDLTTESEESDEGEGGRTTKDHKMVRHHHSGVHSHEEADTGPNLCSGTEEMCHPHSGVHSHEEADTGPNLCSGTEEVCHPHSGLHSHEETDTEPHSNEELCSGTESVISSTSGTETTEEKETIICNRIVEQSITRDISEEDTCTTEDISLNEADRQSPTKLMEDRNQSLEDSTVVEESPSNISEVISKDQTGVHKEIENMTVQEVTDTKDTTPSSQDIPHITDPAIQSPGVQAQSTRNGNEFMGDNPVSEVPEDPDETCVMVLNDIISVLQQQNEENVENIVQGQPGSDDGVTTNNSNEKDDDKSREESENSCSDSSNDDLHNSVMTESNCSAASSSDIICTNSSVTKLVVLIVVAAIGGYAIGLWFWNIPDLKEQQRNLQRDVYLLERNFGSCDRHRLSLKRTVDWLTDEATVDLNQVQDGVELQVKLNSESSPELKDKYFHFTYGTYENNKKLVQRNEIPVTVMKSLQETNSRNLQLLDQVNRLKLEKEELVKQIGVIRYGSPPDTGGRKIIKEEVRPDPVDSEDKTSDDRHLTEKIDALEKELKLEQGRAEMWESLYLKEKGEKSCKDRKFSGKDLLESFGDLLNNMSLPKDVSEILTDNWDSVKSRSLDGWQLVTDLVSKMNPQTEDTGSHPPDGRQSSGAGSGTKNEKDIPPNQQQEKKKSGPLPKWAETMNDMFNKTKMSVSDVSKQIQDTWEQVKPSLASLKITLSENMGKVSKHLSGLLQKSKNKLRKNQHQEAFGRQQRSQQHEDNDEKGSQRASTKRRGPRNPEGLNSENHRKGEHPPRRRVQKRYAKLRHRVEHLNLKRFKRMDKDDIEDFCEKLERFRTKFGFSALNSDDSKWLECQHIWWLNAFHGTYMESTVCREVITCWQVEIMTGVPNVCIQQNQNHANNHHNAKKVKCRGRHRHGHCKGKHHRNHGMGKRSHCDGEPEPATTQENNDTVRKSDEPEELASCNPAVEDCGHTDGSWYTRQMKHREDQRVTKEEDTEEADWMFTRAEDREFQRTLPDNWYFRRLDNNQPYNTDWSDHDMD